MTQTKTRHATQRSWITDVTKLAAAMKKWAAEQGWLVQSSKKTITDDGNEPYEVPALLIQTPQVRLHVDPIGADIMGADGRVDIVAFPSLHRMVLILDNGRWALKTDSYIAWPEGWSKKTFLKLAEILGKA